MRTPRPPIDLTPYTLVPPSIPSEIRWPDVFGNDHPVELEVGSGKGLFLANAGASHPGRNFVGVELAKKYAGKAAERVAKGALSNVRVVAGDARLFLSKCVAPGSLAAVHIYFPDPWWKARHKKRRVFCAAFVEDVERALQPAGDFFMATDVEEYFGVMIELMGSHPRFLAQPTPEPGLPGHDLDYLTNFERKFRIEGRPIYRAHYRLGSD